MNTVTLISQVLHTFRHTLKINRMFSFLLFIGFCMSLFIIYLINIDWYTNWIDPMISFMTLLVAVGISFFNYFINWKESLPKSLTVHFTYGNKYYLSCYYSDLSSPGDIRQWSQQIGKQMADMKDLNLQPFFDLAQPEVGFLESNKQVVYHYQMTMKLKDLTIPYDRTKTILSPDQYKIWYIIHDPDHIADENIKMDIRAPQATPYEPTYAEVLQKKSNTDNEDNNNS